MSDYSIFDFKVRANYSNYNAIKFFLLNETPPDPEILNNFLQPEIEYLENRDSEPSIISVHFLDIPFLCRENKEEGKEYLSHFLRAQKGITKSKEIIDKFRTGYKQEKQQLKNICFTENEFVVPSSTDQKYSEDEISQKGAILLDLTQRLYPVPDFCVLTSKTFFCEGIRKAKTFGRCHRKPGKDDRFATWG